MLDEYIKTLDDNANPEIPSYLVTLYQSALDFKKLIESGQGEDAAPIKLSKLRTTLTKLIADIEGIQHNAAKTRLGVAFNEVDKDLSPRIPTGLSAMMARMLRVTTSIANSTIFAEKGDRISQSELIQSYHDSFPFDAYEDMLSKTIAAVRKSRTSQRMGHNNVGDKAMADLAKSYSKYYNAIPTKAQLRGLDFRAFKMPVTPLFKDLSAQIEPERLTRAHFKVTQVGDGYILLEDQYIITFDFKALGIESNFKKTKGGFKPIRRVGGAAVQHNENRINKLLDVIDQINSRSAIKYVLASEKYIPNPRAKELWMAWIVTEAQHRILQQVLRTTEVDWGLPFALPNGIALADGEDG